MTNFTAKRGSRILVIEDDPVLNEQLMSLLRDQGYHVDKCFDGEEGLTEAASSNHDLILLDVMLPGRDGLSLLNILRNSCDTPVIIVSAKHAEEERVKGLSAGADDYLAKPFNTQELLLRVDAILRRSRLGSKQEATVLSLDGLTIDRRQQTVHANDTVLDVTPTQLNLLWTLVKNQAEVLSKAFLYQTVLNRSYSTYDRSLDMHLSRVRRKLNEAGWDGARLQTVHGKGYCFR